jgi:hypothetical protein
MKIGEMKHLPSMHMTLSIKQILALHQGRVGDLLELKTKLGPP